jgi:hypothetical protein
VLKTLAAKSLRDIWWTLWRGTVWVSALRLVAYGMDLEWSWKLFALCIASSFIDFALYHWRS